MTVDDLVRHIGHFGGEISLRRWPRRVLWGVAPTGAPHFGYSAALAMLKLFAAHGAEIILLIANQHGVLDSQKIAECNVTQGTEIYKREFLQVGVPDNWFVETDRVYSRPDYLLDMMRLTANMSLAETLSSSESTLRSGYCEAKTVGDVLYTITQIYDVVALGVDCVVCGLDEAPIYRYGLKVIEEREGRAVSYVYLPLLPGITQHEMHASDDVGNKLSLSAAPDAIEAAWRRAPLVRAYMCEFLVPILLYNNPAAQAFSASDVHRWLRGKLQ